MEANFNYKNLSCSSLELFWKDKNEEENALNSYEYELSLREGNDKRTIYKGKNNN